MSTSIKQFFLFVLMSFLVVGTIACKTKQKSVSTVRFQNRSWALKALNSKPVVNPADAKPVVINFGVNDFSGCGGCNNMNGLYTVKDDMIKFGSVMSTRMFCQAAIYETDFFAALDQANKFRIQEVKKGKEKKQQLILLRDDKVLAVFE